MTRETTDLEKEIFEYLNELRESGITNMYGSAPYVVEYFGIGKKDARQLVAVWMDNFNEEGVYEEITDNHTWKIKY